MRRTMKKRENIDRFCFFFSLANRFLSFFITSPTQFGQMRNGLRVIVLCTCMNVCILIANSPLRAHTCIQSSSCRSPPTKMHYVKNKIMHSHLSARLLVHLLQFLLFLFIHLHSVGFCCGFRRTICVHFFERHLKRKRFIFGSTTKHRLNGIVRCSIIIHVILLRFQHNQLFLVKQCPKMKGQSLAARYR